MIAHAHAVTTDAPGASVVTAVASAVMVFATVIAAAVAFVDLAVDDVADERWARWGGLIRWGAVLISCSAALVIRSPAVVPLIAGLVAIADATDRRWRALGAVLALVGLLVIGGDLDGSRLDAVALSVHVAAGAVWVGAAVRVAIASPSRRGALLRALGPLVTVAVVAVLVTGALNVGAHVRVVTDVAQSWYGRALIVKVVAVVLALAVGVLARRRVSIGAPLLVTATMLGATLGVIPLTSVHLTELVAPSTDAECASQLLGRQAAARSHNAVIDARTTGTTDLAGCGASDDVSTGRAIATYLQHRGISRIAVVTSDDSRSHAFAHSITDDVQPIDAADAIVVATSWEDTPAALARVRSSNRLVLLAPWLVRASILALPVNDPSVGQLTFAATVDLTSPIAASYVQDLARVAPTAEPSAAGLEGYVEVLRALSHDTARDVATVQLLASSAVGIIPAQLDPGHVHAASAWLPPGGTLVPVSPVLR